jgi:signal transduction histidine kinase
MNNQKIEHSLKFRIFISIFIILTIFTLIKFIKDYSDVNEKILSYVLDTNKTINKFLAENIRGYIYNYDLENIHQLVDSIDNPYINNILVINNEGKILYSKIKNDQIGEVYPIESLSKRNDFIVYTPFKLIDVNIGYQIIEANIQQYNKELSDKINELILYAGLSILLGVILSWIISIQITKPINSMINKLIVTPKNKPILFNIQKINEFNFLANTFQEERNKLIELNNSLSSKIDEEVKKNTLFEKRLHESEKLVAMGEMIGNIAHQWRQPLSFISTLASGIKVNYQFNILDLNSLPNDMDNIVLQTQYLSKTIDDFRNFVKNTNIKSEFSILNLLDKLINITKSILTNSNITLIKNFEADYTISGFENELIQSFINILNNAKDAMEENKLENKLIFIETKIIDSKKQLIIYDNGGGIKDEIIDKIFEPYFTTKHKSLGTGIGLSMVYNILVIRHEVNLEVNNYLFEYENNKYIGAKFTIIFT